MIEDENKILHRAIVAWKKHCTRNGFIYDTPANTSYIDDYNIVHLVNIRGTLAKYKFYVRADRLKMMK